MPAIPFLPYAAFAFTAGVLSLAAPLAFADEKTDKEKIEAPEIETTLVTGKRQGSYTIITEDTQKLVDMPGAMGDPLAAITALPGVITPASGGAPAVRGSSPSDNRYFVDGMPAGYIFHAFNTSIIDENIIQDFQLYSAGFSAQYADATGAVFDIRLRDPEKKTFTTTITASMLRSGVLLESQLTENSAFYLSARAGMLQFFLPEDDEPNDEGFRIISAPSDSDYVFKYLWDKNGKNRISINFMGATDAVEAELTDLVDFVAENPDYAGDAKIEDQFNSQSLVWDYAFDSGIELQLLTAHYAKNSQMNWGQEYFQELIPEDILLKSNILLPLNDSHTLNLGAEQDQIKTTYKIRAPLFVCTEFDVSCQDTRREIIDTSIEKSTTQNTVYAIDQWQVNDTLTLETGLQWHNNNQTKQSLVHPRLSLAWAINEALTFKTSAGSYDRLPDPEYTIAEIGNPDLQAYEAKHYTLGFEGDIYDDWTWSIEGYHKNLTQLPLALSRNEPDADAIYTNDVEGEANGVDIFINRNFSSRWYGWMSLSYAQSTRTNTRTQQKIDYTFDTPLVFNIVGNYQINSLWNTGFRFTAKSGEANTEIVGIKENPQYSDKYLPVYGEPFTDRLPLYARLDIRIERELNWFNHEGAFYVDIINALNRQNVSDIGLDYEKVEETGELHVVKNADMGIFPSIGVSFSF